MDVVLMDLINPCLRTGGWFGGLSHKVPSPDPIKQNVAEGSTKTTNRFTLGNKPRLYIVSFVDTDTGEEPSLEVFIQRNNVPLPLTTFRVTLHSKGGIHRD